jgi:hypothetical protein
LLVRLLTACFVGDTLLRVVSKEALLSQLAQLAQSMVQGSLSELTRQCGDPSCACAWDPARRHGPHLYLRYSEHGKAQSVYVPSDQAQPFKDAQHAWQRFQQMSGELAADNRRRLLAELERSKRRSKAERARARRRAAR